MEHFLSRLFIGNKYVKGKHSWKNRILIKRDTKGKGCYLSSGEVY